MDANQAKTECDGKIRKFNRLLRKYEPNDYGEHSVARNNAEWTREVSIALDDMVDSIESMGISHGQTLGSTEVAVWNESINTGERQFKEFVAKVDAKLNSQSQNDDTSTRSRTSVQLPDQPSQSGSFAMRAAQADIEVDADIIASDGRILAAEVTKYLDWGEASDEKIVEAMMKIEDWKKRLGKIKEKGWTITRNVKKFDLSDQPLRLSMALINNLESEMEMTIENLKFEDETRCLFSLSRNKTADVMLPIFTGDPEEDFTKFKKEMMKGLKTNRVKKDDQVKKLRENLRDQPRSIIPATLEDVDTAWAILEDLYGDATRVVKARKKMIKNLGPFPKNGKGVAPMQNQIEWITKLEVTLKDLMELGEKSVAMDREVFNGNTTSAIEELFPFKIQAALANFEDVDCKEKLSSIIKYLAELRSIRQRMMKTYEGQANPRKLSQEMLKSVEGFEVNYDTGQDDSFDDHEGDTWREDDATEDDASENDASEDDASEDHASNEDEFEGHRVTVVEKFEANEDTADSLGDGD